MSFRRIRIIWIWFLFALLALLLFSSHMKRTLSWSPAEQVVVEVIAPLQNALTKTVRGVGGVWEKYFGLVRVYEENRILLEEIQSLQLENFRYREMLATQQRLRELLKFKERTNWSMMAAQVIGRDPTGLFKSVIIDKGARSGISMNMPVVSAEGVVGRVVSVSPNYAKVLLIIDQNSAVDCLNQTTRDQGILRGASAEICELDYVLKTSRMGQGDIIITSGMCGVFPKGLPVGRVISVSDRPGALFKDVQVHTMVDFNRLEEILIILKEDSSVDRPKEME
ncbi:MAG: rod shape-determining protein MreC [Thermodesulfobacteriota bacterium]